MNEAIQAIKAANTGITGLQNLLGAASGLIESARTATAADRATLGTQYNQVLAQINKLVSDSGYKGTDFLSGSSTTLDVLFNENGSNKLTLTGFNANWSALGTTAAATVTLSAGTKTSTTTGNFTSAGTKYSTVAHTVSAGGLAVYTNSSGPTITGVNSAANWSVASTFTTSLNTAADTITSATAALQTQASKLSSNLSIINARLDFTTSMVNVEKTGADNLTLADTNQEGANMLALQTRQSLGVTSLSLASQANQAILRLF
jgi:flagellin-like hook-associated protein FlgL